jgi:hypothetical protein
MAAPEKAPAVTRRRTVAELEAELERRTAELQARTTERDEAEAQKAALAEVIEIINSSPGDLAPVFDAMLEKATRLCEGDQGLLWTFDGEQFHAAALRGVSPEFATFLREPLRPAPSLPLGRVMCGEPLVRIADMKSEPAYHSGEPLARAGTNLNDVRTLTVIGLRKDESLLGAFAISRREVKPLAIITLT